MPFREKLKKALHLDNEYSTKDGSKESSPLASPRQSTGHADTKQGQVPLSGRKSLSTENGYSVAHARNSSGIDRGISAGQPENTSQHSKSTTTNNTPRSKDVISHSEVPSATPEGQYSEKVATRNITQTKDQNAGSSPLHSNGTASHSQIPAATSISTTSGRPRGESISRKAVSPSALVGTESAKTTSRQLDRKPNSPDLRDSAGFDNTNTRYSSAPTKVDTAASKHVKDSQYLVKDAAVAPALDGVVDLRNTVDTTVDEKWAPAVVHETVNREVHHIREEVVTREIHNYHIFHRILPIIDVEVLPARHFVPDGRGGKIEISEDEIPGRTGPYQRTWAIVENVTRDNVVLEPRKFTARQFRDGEGDYKEYISAAGVPTTETTWIHPPTIEEFGEYTGQTEPFHFGSKDSRDDGLRVYAPTGPITGCSRLYAEQNGYTIPPTEEMNKLSLNGLASKDPASNLTPPHTGTRAEFARGLDIHHGTSTA